MIKRTSRRAPRPALSILAALFCASACGVDLPPQLPTTGAHDRMASRVELVDLVISDSARAEKVRSLYIEMGELMRDAKKAEAAELVKLGVHNVRSDAETHAAVTNVRRAELAALERYIYLQLEVRRSLSAEEFAELDAVK